MEWSKLPKEYRDLDYVTSNYIELGLDNNFWMQCLRAKTTEDLPLIPKPKMTEQFKEAGEKAGENYVQYLLEQIAIKDKQMENLKASNESLRDEIKEANTYIESQKIDVENLEKEIDKLKEESTDQKKWIGRLQIDIENLVDNLNIKDKQIKEESEFINQQSQQIEQAAIYIEKYKIDIENLKGSNDRLKAELRGENPSAFYMVFVDGMVFSPTEKHKTLEDAITEANRLSTNNESVVHVLAHVESYQRKITITIEQVK
jgi:chromosome segregation ATPase